MWHYHPVAVLQQLWHEGYGEGYLFPQGNGDIVHLSEEGFNFIVGHEVVDQEWYEANAATPVHPTQKSGVTIGVGYDLGYQSAAQIEEDWGDDLDASMVDRLQNLAGVTGSEAGKEVSNYQDVSISWDTATHVFEEKVLSRYVSTSYEDYPEMVDLHPHCQGALVSLIYNRGPVSSRHRKRHMRKIQQALENGNEDQIPKHFRDMKVVWPNKEFLQRRREEEAELFERGLRANR